MSTPDNGKCCSRKWRESKPLLLVVVTIGAFLDSMLISTVVPIFPNHLYKNQLSNMTDSLNHTESWTNQNKTQNSSVAQYESTIPILTSQISTPSSNTSTNCEVAQECAGLKMGILLASKPFVQLLVNPLVGSYANRYSYRKMMSLGFAVMFSSTLMYAFAIQYSILLFARSLQGVASSFISIVGITALADRFTDEKKRANAIRIALAGLGIGLSVGPPFGGFTYQYIGKTSPFLILCVLIFIDTCLLALTAQPSSVKKKKEIKQTPFLKLIVDPYILIVTGGVFLTCACYAIIESELPLFMMENMNSSTVEMGLVFVPYSVTFFIITAIIGRYCLKLERWLLSAIGCILTGVSLVMFPFCRSISHIYVPSSIMGLGAGLVDIALMPEIARLVDLRHSSVYGNAFAIVDISMCLGLTVSPPLAGMLLKYFSFVSIMIGGSVFCFIYVPLIYLLKEPPAKNCPTPPKELLEIKIAEIAKTNDLS